MLSFSMKYVQIDANGRYRYRRVIPERLRPLLGRKREFLKVLGRTEEEALQQYARTHALFDRQLTAAKKLLPQGGSEQNISKIKAELDKLGIPTSAPVTADEEYYRAEIGEELLAGLDQDPQTGDLINEAHDKKALIKAIYQGVNDASMTVADAIAYYLEIRAKRENSEERKRQLVRFKNLERIIEATIGLNTPLVGLSRPNARRLANYLLESGNAVGTVRRYLTDIRAVINLALREHDIPARNPFSQIDLPDDGLIQRDRRISMPDDVIEKMLTVLKAKKNLQPYFVFTLLYLTGARLAEITGLRRNDVFLESEIPHIRIQPNEIRRLKTKWSDRQIPLCPNTHFLLQDALRTNSTSDYLFPNYIDGRGADRASAWLMKVLRAQTEDERIAIHSLRHNFRDRIRIIGIPFEHGKALEGRKFSQGEEAHYGYTSERWLKALHKDIKRINNKELIVGNITNNLIS